MSATNQTTHYELPSFLGSDKPAWLVDWNGAMATIDAAIYEAKTVADGAAAAATTNASNISTLQTTVSGIASDLGTVSTSLTSLQGTVNTITSLIGNGEPTTTDKTIIGAINEIHSSQISDESDISALENIVDAKYMIVGKDSYVLPGVTHFADYDATNVNAGLSTYLAGLAADEVVTLDRIVVSGYGTFTTPASSFLNNAINPANITLFATQMAQSAETVVIRFLNRGAMKIWSIAPTGTTFADKSADDSEDFTFTFVFTRYKVIDLT